MFFQVSQDIFSCETKIKFFIWQGGGGGGGGGNKSNITKDVSLKTA